MRIAAYAEEGRRTQGVIEDDLCWPLPQIDILRLLELPTEERERVVADAKRDGDPRQLAALSLLAPLRPTTLRDFVTFEQHAEGVAKSLGPNAVVAPEWYEAPFFYFSNTNTIHGPGDDVHVPPGSTMLDFELEVAAVIGRRGSDLSPKAARDHIVAYTIFNDFSARDHGAREARLGLGMSKAKDFANVIGPWLVTADELEPHRRGDRLDLELVATVNDRENGRDSLASMAWSFEEMVAYASRGSVVAPGDLLASGTCGGGCLAELWGRNGRIDPPPLQVGDVVTLSVQGIGTLATRVVTGADVIDIPPARSRAGARSA
jgi:2-keto-4-pentenoate hydratase/2-oxohepta-3-ene-1,7-dioic acid hydratase in catechol pathway